VQFLDAPQLVEPHPGIDEALERGSQVGIPSEGVRRDAWRTSAACRACAIHASTIARCVSILLR
jgi:hypothetical protein